MFAAAEAGDVGTVKELLEAGIDPNVRDRGNETPLIKAAQKGHEEVFFALVHAGADVHATRGYGECVLRWAVTGRSRSRLKMVRAVIADGGIQPDDRLPNAFPVACRYGSKAMVEALLGQGAEVNHEYLPLLAAIEGNRPEIVAVLLDAGARANLRVPKREYRDNTHRGKTVLELAIAEGYTEIAKLLRAAGAKAPPKKKRRAKPAPVADSWKRIGKWLQENAPAWKPLKKGATAKQLEAAQAALGLELPEDVRESYRVHNGSDEAGFFPSNEAAGYYLMTLSEAVQDWKRWKSLAEAGEFERVRPKADKGIRGDWWNAAWVPFASNGGGDHYCIDLAPAAGGKKGQVITMDHESGEHKLLGDSLRQWLGRFANDLEDGRYRYDEKEGLV